jgi:hypothetical protein
MVSAEASLRELGIELPQAPKPFGAYVAAVLTGHLLFLTGMLLVENQKPKFGKELDGAVGREEHDSVARVSPVSAPKRARTTRRW